jgi:hypothetical protein
MGRNVARNGDIYRESESNDVRRTDDKKCDKIKYSTEARIKLYLVNINGLKLPSKHNLLYLDG